MKKRYNVPATTVVTLNVRQMLAASPNTPPSPGVDPNAPGVDPSGFDTRKHQGVGGGLWSDMQ